jgi:glycosyltransferase involved in cell wall biosynthesis
MRVLCLAPRALLGGVEQVIVESAASLSLRGHEVHVVLPAHGPVEERLIDAADIHIVPYNPWVGVGLSRLTWTRWSVHDTARALPRLIRLTRRLRPDVVMTESITIPIGACAARACGIPHAWFLHEFGDEHHGWRYLLGYQNSVKAINRLADTVIVPSEAVRTHFAPLLPRPKLMRVNCAVEMPSRIEPVARDSNGFLAVLMGQRTASKGQREAVEAVVRLRAAGLDVELELIGAGDPRFDRELIALIEASGLEAEIRLLDFLPQPFGRLACADVALMCSPREAFGRVTIEAMKLGKPVIGASGGATADLIRDMQTGLLYEPGDIEGLCEAIRSLHDDRSEARSIGERGREWATATFNASVHADQLEEALVETVGSRRQAGRTA